MGLASTYPFHYLPLRANLGGILDINPDEEQIARGIGGASFLVRQAFFQERLGNVESGCHICGSQESLDQEVGVEDGIFVARKLISMMDTHR